MWMTERRKFLRFDAAINALCDIVSERWKARYKVVNISKEGALVVLDKELRAGDEVRLSVDVPGDNIPIFAAGQVAWQRESNSTNMFDTGIKFTNIDSTNRGRLLEYIYTQWLRLIDKE